jgi:hypothetical protein
MPFDWSKYLVLARFLLTLEDGVWRNLCDYEDNLSGLNSMVLMALRDAEHVIRQLQ